MKHLLVAALLSVALAACESESLQPDYGRSLPSGASALIPLGPGEPRPDYAGDWSQRQAILPALDRSIEWTSKASAARHFPIAGISHERALKSLQRFREILTTSPSAADFKQQLDKEFTVYKSAGWDGAGGGVLFTGYCTPILDGSRERTDVCRYPLYALPPDLAKDKDGNILGQQTASGLQPYPDRRTIESSGLLAGKGLELAWLKSPLDAYIAHVNGSAVIRLPDGALFRLGYAGKNRSPYTSLRGELVRDGKLKAEEANLASIREWAAAHPDEVPAYLARNASYVFFTPIEGNPRGSLNVEVSPERTLATDKALFPRGAITFVDSRPPSGTRRNAKPFHSIMFDQDTGEAIRTAGRADIYLGMGPAAERLAGATEEEGQLYYLFLAK